MKRRHGELIGYVRAEARKCFSVRALATLAVLAAAIALINYLSLRTRPPSVESGWVGYIVTGMDWGMHLLGYTALVSLAAFMVSFEHSNGTLKEIRLIHPRPYSLYVAKALAVLSCATWVLFVTLAVAGSLYLARRGQAAGDITLPFGPNDPPPLGLLMALALLSEYLTVLNLCLVGFCIALLCKSPAAAAGAAACLFLVADTLKVAFASRYVERAVFWHQTKEVWNDLVNATSWVPVTWTSTVPAALLHGLVTTFVLLGLFRLLVWRRVEH